MKAYGVNELRKMFLEFFESKGHLAMKSFSLVPHNDIIADQFGYGALKTVFYWTGDSAQKESDHLPEVHPHRRY